jgi:hypothetical protein
LVRFSIEEPSMTTVGKRHESALLLCLTLCLLFPVKSMAQSDSAIAGAVKDTSGAVLPGVTVEVSSAALIERTRTAVTDEQGLYKIVNLRPGTYSVSFTLTGFSTSKRDGIEVPAGFTATVNAELRVGSIEETVTVAGQSPLVDIQNSNQGRLVSRNAIDAIPSGKTFQNMAELIPGVVIAGSASGSGIQGQDVGGSAGATYVYLSIHGSRGLEMPLLLDGLRYNNMNGQGGGYNTVYKINDGSVQEINVQVSGMSAESWVSGVRINVISREGGNSFRGLFFGSYTNDKLEADNLDAALIARGATPFSYPVIYDINPAFGGPIRRDKLWFYSAFRYWGNQERPPGTFYNKSTQPFVYTPDLTRPAHNENWNRSTNLRLTWQASPRNKFSAFYDNGGGCSCNYTISATTTPDASTRLILAPNYIVQTTWNSTLTNRLLIDAGFQGYITNHPTWSEPGISDTMYSVLEQSTGVRFGAPASEVYRQHRQYNGKANVSYVTGSHSLKVGGQWMWGYRHHITYVNNNVTLNVLNGMPQSLTENATPLDATDRVRADVGLFAQDQWTIRHVTLNYGLRFDYLDAYVPAQQNPPTQFVGPRNFPEVANVPSWKDLDPRVGGTWDVFGNGKTALKASLGRYVLGMTTDFSGANNPLNTSTNSASRTWNDISGTGNPSLDCNLANPLANGGCGPLNNQNFGNLNIVTRYDPSVLSGWGVRPFNWEEATSIEHEIRPGLSVNATFDRHWWGNFLVTDNLAATPVQFDPYCITAPVDSRLPGGGGFRVCNLFDVAPAQFGQVNNLVTSASKYGSQSDVYTGFDLGMNVRLASGVILQGGTSTGHEVTDNCDVVGRITGNAATGQYPVATPNLSGIASPSSLYCHIAPPMQTQVKVLGSVPLPWLGLQTSATFQSIPGPQILASYVATNAIIAPSLGRNLSAGANGTATVQLIAPGTQYGDRLNQVDFRLSKILVVGGTRIQGNLDVYNSFNANPVLLQNNQFGSAWQKPLNILAGRLLKFGVQIYF